MIMVKASGFKEGRSGVGEKQELRNFNSQWGKHTARNLVSQFTRLNEAAKGILTPYKLAPKPYVTGNHNSTKVYNYCFLYSSLYFSNKPPTTPQSICPLFPTN